MPMPCLGCVLPMTMLRLCLLELTADLTLHRESRPFQYSLLRAHAFAELSFGSCSPCLGT